MTNQNVKRNDYSITDFIIKHTNVKVCFKPNEYKLYCNGKVSLTQVKFRPVVASLLSNNAYSNYLLLFVFVCFYTAGKNPSIIETVSCLFGKSDIAYKSLDNNVKKLSEIENAFRIYKTMYPI